MTRKQLQHLYINIKQDLLQNASKLVKCYSLLAGRVMFPQAVSSLPTENAVQCRTTTYGCCYDRTTPAGGANGEGCPNPPNHSKTMISF